jgi:hypothetical protein
MPSQFGDRVVDIVLVDPPADARPAAAGTSYRAAGQMRRRGWRAGRPARDEDALEQRRRIARTVAGALSAFLNRLII